MPNRKRKIHRRMDIPDWRDPEMPVTWPLWDNWTNKVVIVEVPPHEAQAMAREMFRDNPGLNWRNDPSYNWGKRQ